MELFDEPMAKHTTLKIGGPARKMLIPESEEELLSAVRQCRREGTPFRIVGNGSNILVNDEGLDEVIIKTTRACLRLECEGKTIYAGASVKIQRFVRFCAEHDLGGFEYLISVPATVGGVVFMNAGRGRHLNQQISDGITSVRVFDGEKIFELNKDECQFKYREFIFHWKPNWVILGAYLELKAQDRLMGEQAIQERKDFVREQQDYRDPSAGSVFKSGRLFVFKHAQGLKIGDAEFSKKAVNWINNRGQAKARDVLKLIKIVKWMNWLTFKKAKEELRLW
jgi:UDP-N-acetylmuramate dehydrogenase